MGGWVAVGLGNFFWVEGNCIWDPRKKFQANCFENGRVIAISLGVVWDTPLPGVNVIKIARVGKG